MRAEVALTAEEDEDADVLALMVEGGVDNDGLGVVEDADAVDAGREAECVQSGTWIETSTNGSMVALSTISRPEASLRRGSCWAEMI